MTKISLALRTLKIPLKASFKQASFTRYSSESIWIEAKRGNIAGYGEGCPRKYVTGEDLPGSLEWISENTEVITNQCTDLNNLKLFVKHQKQELDAHPAAWSAVELALLDLFARENKVSVEGLLHLPEVITKTFTYTAVLSDDSPEAFGKRLEQFKRFGFKDYKVKISGDLDSDRKKFELLQSRLQDSTHTLRVDANNLWGNDYLKADSYFAGLPLKFFGIEEPFDPRNFEAMAALSQSQETAIILDESGRTMADLEEAAESGARVMLNIKIAKAGGILRSMSLVDKAKAFNIPVIVGAHVGETSVLTRAGMLVAAYAGSSLTGHEGGFGEYLLERDVAEPVVQLGKNGQIKLGDSYSYPTDQGLVDVPAKNWELGWGLRLRDQLGIHRQ